MKRLNNFSCFCLFCALPYIYFQQIEELLQQGKGTGQYAQMLREILRKMSKDDTQLQLKSLEQVLALGHNIAQLDSQERLHEARIAHGHSTSNPHGVSNQSLNNSLTNSGKKASRSPSPRRGRPPSSIYAEDLDLPVYESRFLGAFTRAVASPPSSRAGHGGVSNNYNNNNTNDRNNNRTVGDSTGRVFLSVAQHQQNTGASRGNVISRVAKVPGLTPDPGVKKQKKVFGHAVK